MSVLDKQPQANGIAFLNLSAWIRRQKWLRAIYKHAPDSWRNRVSLLLAHRAERSLRFQRTDRWRLSSQTPSHLLPLPHDGPQRVVEPSEGVNVFGFTRGEFGLAESARLYIRSLLVVGYPTAVCDVPIQIAHSMGDKTLDLHLGTSAPFDINIVFVNPDYMAPAMAAIGAQQLAGRYTIGCWFWELENFPVEWLPALDDVDAILVSSEFIRAMLAKVTHKPVIHIPLPVDNPHSSDLVRLDFGLDPDAFVFLTTFDFNSFLPRKNPLASIFAFRHAFPDLHQKVQLVVKSSNGHRHPERLRELLDAAAGDPRILVRDEVIDRRHISALQHCADAYVSLHRSEGFGLGMAECMRIGKPVIATAWSGNLDFMNSGNACLVDFRLVSVEPDQYLHTKNQRWAEPDVNHAAQYMQRLVTDLDYRERIGAQAALDMRKGFSLGLVGASLAAWLSAVRADRDSTRAGTKIQHNDSTQGRV